MNMNINNDILSPILKKAGEKHPKKHGEWYRLHVYDNHYLVLDTWNGHVYHYSNGAKPSSTFNLYNCVYVFYDKNGKVDNYERVKNHMNGFWYGHIFHLKYR